MRAEDEPDQDVTLLDVPWDLYVDLRDLHENRHTRMTYHDGTLTLMPPEPGRGLRAVSWETYQDLRAIDANHHTRMTYHDGMLFLMSPEYRHDFGADRLAAIVREVADAFDIEYASTRTTTLRRVGVGTLEGDAKEPDAGFYLGENELSIRGKTTIDLDVIPPPDLAIEVGDKSDSEVALLAYASLLLPEVWRYDDRERTLWFGRLKDGSYDTIDRSVCLPMLTPDLVLDALNLADVGTGEKTWVRRVRAWARLLAAGPGP